MDDFLQALLEVKPAFGASSNDLELCRDLCIVVIGKKLIYEKVMFLVEQAKVNERSRLSTCLLYGPIGSGKTALAATIGIDSDFPYVKIVSAQYMNGHHESKKCVRITKVFEDAYKSPMSIVILDDIERLLEYTEIGPRFSDEILHTLLMSWRSP